MLALGLVVTLTFNTSSRTGKYLLWVGHWDRHCIGMDGLGSDIPTGIPVVGGTEERLLAFGFGGVLVSMSRQRQRYLLSGSTRVLLE